MKPRAITALERFPEPLVSVAALECSESTMRSVSIFSASPAPAPAAKALRLLQAAAVQASSMLLFDRVEDSSAGVAAEGELPSSSACCAAVFVGLLAGVAAGDIAARLHCASAPASGCGWCGEGAAGWPSSASSVASSSSAISTPPATAAQRVVRLRAAGRVRGLLHAVTFHALSSRLYPGRWRARRTEVQPLHAAVYARDGRHDRGAAPSWALHGRQRQLRPPGRARLGVAQRPRASAAEEGSMQESTCEPCTNTRFDSSPTLIKPHQQSLTRVSPCPLSFGLFSACHSNEKH